LKGDFDDAWTCARALDAHVIKEPSLSDEALQTQEFTVHDPDGYVVGIGDRSKGWLANSGLK